jgi:hypothetical protein
MTWRFPAILAALLVPVLAFGQTAGGRLSANGKPETLFHAAAYEVDSSTEPGYLDVVVLLSDRRLPRAAALSPAILEELMLKNGLVALRLVLDPDGQVKSAAPYHPAFKNFIQSGTFMKWKPTTYNVNKVAGRVYTNGEQQFAGQHWNYDITFSAPIELDPAAKTTLKKK